MFNLSTYRYRQNYIYDLIQKKYQKSEVANMHLYKEMIYALYKLRCVHIR